MSAQAGVWNLDGRPADRGFLAKLSAAIMQFGPDGENVHLDGSVGMLYRPFHTTTESHREHQPHVSANGVVIMWDGRLDNREDLIRQLHNELADSLTDVEIVAASFARWATDCFQQLIGDWAISIWDPANKRLILSKDYMGMRHLFYYMGSKNAIWCKYLAPIVLLSGVSFTLNDEYIADYLAAYPRVHLTPYREIQAVPPGTFVIIHNGKATDYRYWSFESSRTIRYKTDAQYEEHFRDVFFQAVKHRLRSNLPILAELSGGIDSSSIICVADDLLARGEAETPRLDTLSLYDPNEPQGDERPYITRIEERRGRMGHHLDIGKYGYSFSLDYYDFIVVPGFSKRMEGVNVALSELTRNQDYRVVLSGTGGDEFLGGVPNPLPQLADLIIPPHPIKLGRSLAAWSLIKKRPRLHLLFQALLLWLPPSIRLKFTEQAKVATWIDTRFARRYNIALRQLGPQGRYGFWQPSRRDYAQTLVAATRQFAYCSPHTLGCEERRYPFLDQALIEFLLSISPNQLLRPGQRRSLMRRSLANIVPPEILWRKTKGTIARSPLVAFQNTWAELERLLTAPLGAGRGYVDRNRLLDSLHAAKNGNAPQLVRLLKAVFLELWLRSLAEHNVIRLNAESHVTLNKALSPQEVRPWL